MSKPKNYVPVVTRRQYAVPLPMRDFARLTERENKQPELDNDLGTALDQLPGVSGTDYNGHFGSYIYYTVDADDDTPELQAQVVELIRKHCAPRKSKE